MNLLRKITLPFVPLYYLVVWIRNWLFDKGVFKSKLYSIPVICVGNLSVGGTGKTPMVEYLVRLLQCKTKLAVLSRGYKRKTKGYIVANNTRTVEDIGDEPFQYFNKFEEIIVAVDANRQNGIESLIKEDVNAIILDDAFQHRKVTAGLNIVLTTFDKPYFKDFVLPTGNLREPRSGVKRADIIIVTKCPKNFTKNDKELFIKGIKPKNHQSVFFSSVSYSKDIFSEKGKNKLSDLKNKTFTLVTGIANPKPLLTYLNGYNFNHLQFNDHHHFSKAEISDLKSKEIILTTEKDFMRLKGKIASDKLFYLPIETIIEDFKSFNKIIIEFIEEFKRQ